MKRACYIVAGMLAFTWTLTFFVLRAGSSAIHIFLLLAVICGLHATIAVPQKKCIMGEMDEEKLGRQKQTAA